VGRLAARISALSWLLSDYATPYEKLKSPTGAARYLKPKLAFAQLDPAASRMSDTECARRMGAAKRRIGKCSVAALHSLKLIAS
jgi:hypothetical protein